MENKTVKFMTLGCKVNQYETQGMVESLESKGVKDISQSESSSDFVVVNTCTVTGEADKNNRYWIRRMKRENPDATMVVTGCYVEKNRSEIESMPEVDLILSNYNKDKIGDQLFSSCAEGVDLAEPVSKTKFSPLSVSKAQGGRTRAYVKIQDGCNHACSFCKIVLVRGRSRSREIESVYDEVSRLRDAGYHEVVFAGIQLGAYGLDFEERDKLRNPKGRSHYYLSDIIEKCAEIEGIERIRLSSIEPIDIGEPLLDTFERTPKFCPHLHIPLQSGDNDVLQGMNRRYDRDFYIELIEKIRSKVSDFQLTLDVMAGFAGETSKQFANTMDLLEKVRPLKCHVFPYSRREGTKAAMIEDLPKSIVKERVQSLMTLETRIADEIKREYLGRDMNVLVEKNVKGNLYEGLTANYLRVYFQSPEDIRGSIVNVKLSALEEGTFLGVRNSG